MHRKKRRRRQDETLDGITPHMSGRPKDRVCFRPRGCFSRALLRDAAIQWRSRCAPIATTP
eukprot:9694383-Alexandrium_andersonii.AAC.1